MSNKRVTIHFVDQKDRIVGDILFIERRETKRKEKLLTFSVEDIFTSRIAKTMNYIKNLSLCFHIKILS